MENANFAQDSPADKSLDWYTNILIVYSGNRVFVDLGPLAQLVERSHGMGEVTGSNPVGSTKNL